MKQWLRKLDEKKLIALLLIYSLSLLLISLNSEPEPMSIKEARENLGAWVRVCGVVKWVKKGRSFTIFKLYDGSSILVFSPRNLEVEKGDVVEVSGLVKIYKGNVEIVVGERDLVRKVG